MKWILVALAGSLLAPATLAGEPDPVEHRHEMMEDNGDALKPMVKMVKGERDFDADLVAQGLETLQHTADHFGKLFPPGSDTSDDRARPEIWSDREGFEADLADFARAVDAAEAADPQSLAELKPVLSDITKACKNCHESYRFEED